jgi:hypothetical protein
MRVLRLGTLLLLAGSLLPIWCRFMYICKLKANTALSNLMVILVQSASRQSDKVIGSCEREELRSSTMRQGDVQRG